MGGGRQRGCTRVGKKNINSGWQENTTRMFTSKCTLAQLAYCCGEADDSKTLISEDELRQTSLSIQKPEPEK